MKTKLPLRIAEEAARSLVAELAPLCDRVDVAGSVRRHKPEVGDLEIVAIAKPVTNLFFEPTDVTEIDYWLADSGIIPTKNGGKYKQFQWGSFQVDLFLATEDNYGLILMLRTGPAEFSRRMVTLTAWGGYKPSDLFVSDGYVWSGEQRVAVPDEQTLFALWGMAYVEPADRTAEAQRA